MAAVEKQALAWRSQYDVDLENLGQQRTQVRAYVSALRNEAELQEGRRRLHEAIQFKNWRKAQVRVSAIFDGDAIGKIEGVVDVEGGQG
jgi:hypothetical protein